MQRRRMRKWEDAFWGFVVGDAMGLPSEGKTPDQIKQSPIHGLPGHGSYDRKIGTWGQPTAMMWAGLEGALSVRNQVYTERDFKSAVIENLKSWIMFSRYTADKRLLVYSEDVISRLQEWKPVKPAAIDNPDVQGMYACSEEARKYAKNTPMFLALPLTFVGAMYAMAETTSMYMLIEPLLSIFGCDDEGVWAAFYYVVLLHELEKGRTPEQAIENTEARTSRMAESYLGVERHQVFQTGELEYEEGSYEEYTNDVYNPLLQRLYLKPEWSVDRVDSITDIVALSVQVLLQSKTLNEGLLYIANRGGASSTWGAVAGSLLGMAYGRTSLPSLWEGVIARRGELESVFRRAYAAFHEDSPFLVAYEPEEPPSPSVTFEHL